MDPFKNQIDDRTSYKSLDEQFYEARLDRDGIDQSDWPSQIDRAAIDVSYGVALGKTGSRYDYGGTIGRNDFGSACGSHYVDGLRALSGSQSDLPRLIKAYDASELGDLAFRLNELRVELEKLDLGDSDISDLNRTIEALVEKLITQGSSGDLARQPLQKPEAVADLLYQLFSDPAVTTYADVLIDSITGETGTSIGKRSLLEHLDRPQMVTPLWDHQHEAIKQWVTADTKGYVNMATATGKTVLGLAAIAHKFGELHPADTDTIPPVSASSDAKKRVLIVAGQDLLLQQWQSEFDEHLNIPRSRTLQNQTEDANVIELTWGDIEFRTAQELLNTDLQHSYDLVILDEAHRYKSGRRGSRGWRDLFEDLVDTTDSILAMSGSIDDEWLGDDAVKNALEASLEPCIEFTIADARAQNVIADFRWDVCYAASDTDETVDSIASSTAPLASVYNSTHHKFEPHELSDAIPEAVPDQFETLRDLRSFAHTKEGKQARDNNDAFDKFATAAFSRKPKRWQLSPPAEIISQLLEDHLPERKSIVLVQSYAQAEAIGEHLKELYDDGLITVPEQATEAPYDSITDFKDASQGVLVGPGEVLGVGVDLPNADVAINLAKGGVNASLIQRIGRILRNPTGEKQAHFYQVVTIANSPDARLPGEDGRRLLRRASEFRALGSRFRELPGFVVADSTASEIVRVLETHGSQAKIKDERPTEEMVEDDVARRFLDELTTEVDSKVGESLTHPVLTTHWKPESLSPGTLPVRESVEQLDEDGQSESRSDTTTESEFEPEAETTDTPATVIVEITDESGETVPEASVVLENPSPIAETTTDTDGEAIFNLPVFSDDLCAFVSKEGYQNCFTSVSVSEGEQTLSIKMTNRTQKSTTNKSPPESPQGVEEDNSEDSLSDSPSREEIIAEIRRIIETIRTYPMRSDFIEESDLEITDVYDHFDSWHEAYEATVSSVEEQKTTNSNQSQNTSTDTSESKDTQQNDEENSNLSSADSPSREEVLAEIRKVGEKVRTFPMRSDFVEESDMDVKHVYEYFRSWSKAYRASEAPTKQEIKTEISRLQGEIGTDLTTTEFEEHSDIDIEHVEEKFDSWRDAVQAAGHSESTTMSSDSNGTQSDESKTDTVSSGIENSNEEENHSSEPSDISGQSPASTNPSNTDEADLYQRDLLIELVSQTQELQRVPTKDEINDFGKFKYRDYATEFGDLYEAAQQAGIIEDSVTRSEFFATVTRSEFADTEETNNDHSEPIDESKEVTGPKAEEEHTEDERPEPSGRAKSSSLSTSDFAELTSFQRDILIVLAGSTGRNGLNIKNTLEQYYDSEVNHGRLYPNLDSLIELGYVAKQSVDGRTNSYALTELGHSLIDSRKKWVANRAPEAQLETTETETQEATIDPINLSWNDAVRQELYRYQQTHDEKTVSLSEIYDFSEKRLLTQFPDNNNIRAKIRQQLQRLRDEGDVEPLNKQGTYRIQINAEIDSDKPNQSKTPDNQNETKPRPAALIAEIRRVDDEVDGYPLTTEMRQMGKYEPEQYYSEFGSWENALKLSGIDKKERLIEEIQRVARELGREPNTTDMNEYSAYSSGTFSGYFGSWKEALELAMDGEMTELLESTDTEISSSSTENNINKSDKGNQTKSSDLVDSIMKDIENKFGDQ